MSDYKTCLATISVRSSIEYDRLCFWRTIMPVASDEYVEKTTQEVKLQFLVNMFLFHE